MTPFKNIIAFLFYLILTVIFSQCQQTQVEDPYALTLSKIDEIENKYGIRILYKEFAYRYSAEWQNEFEWTYLSKNELISFVPKLELFLSHYPEAFVRSNLNEMRIFKSLKNKENKPYLGIQGGDGNIRIVLNSISDEYLFSAFHHELAHNVHFLNGHMFPDEEWLKVHDTNNNYIDYGAFYDSDTTYTEDMLYENGFVSYYCTAALSEDFAEYASYHYTKHDFLMELTEQHEAINEKYTLFKEFYNAQGAEIQ